MGTKIQGVHRVSLQRQKSISKANEKTDKWKLLQNERPAYLSFYMGAISCTKHIKMVLDFLPMFAVAYLINGISDPLL